MQKREGRSFAPQPTSPFRPDLGRTGRKGATCPNLPLPAVLSPMSFALSRRAALFGAVTVSGAVAGSAALAMVPAGLSENDARLGAIALELAEIDRFVAAYPSMGSNDNEEDHPAYYEALDAIPQLEDEMAALPADTMAGVLAKVRAQAVPITAHVVHGIADSVCSDLLRLFGGGAHA